MTTYSYDLADNLSARTDANGVTVSYSYDILNRLIAINHGDASRDVTYTYEQESNGIGRLTSIEDAVSTTTYSYDEWKPQQGRKNDFFKLLYYLL